MKRMVKWTVVAVGVVLLTIQLVPIERSNPPIETEVPGSTEAREVLRRACYDCHSNETQWPWYSRIAPVSWKIVGDVREGRDAVNFSTWNRLDTKEQYKAMHEIWEEVAEGEMPPWFYLPLHSDSRLSEHDLSVLRAWSSPAGGVESDDD